MPTYDAIFLNRTPSQLNCNYNGEILPKFDLVITFYWVSSHKFVLTEGQKISSVSKKGIFVKQSNVQRIHNVLKYAITVMDTICNFSLMI